MHFIKKEEIIKLLDSISIISPVVVVLSTATPVKKNCFPKTYERKHFEFEI